MTLHELIEYEKDIVEQKYKEMERYDRASGYTRCHIDSLRTYDAIECQNCAEKHAEIVKYLEQYEEHTKELDKIRKNINEAVDEIEQLAKEAEKNNCFKTFTMASIYRECIKIFKKIVE